MLAILAALAVLVETPHVGTAQPAGQPSRQFLGAIRWDAWFGPRNTVGQAVHRTLGPAKWHDRLPFYARVLGDDAVEIDGTPQFVMDREIEHAAGAGLDYWAFVTYAADDPLSIALDRYLASPIRPKINFCLITECARWSQPAFVDRVTRLLQEPGYQRVLDGRPLLFVGFIEDKWLKSMGGVEGFRKVLDGFRAALAAKGVSKPYMVIMDFSPEQGRKWVDALGADAISSYVAGIGQGAIPYGRMTDNVEHFWEDSRATGAQVVPIVVTGWDPRPRVEHPVPWGGGYSSHAGEVDRSEAATPAAIAEHLRSASRWMNAYRDAAPAQTAIIYAWNEFDEGGWLVPTHSEGPARLDAIAKVRKPAVTTASAPVSTTNR